MDSHETKQSPNGKNEVRLLNRIRALKQKCEQFEIERDEAESREQRLRDTLESEIANALERRSRSMVEKVKAADASKGRSKKELQQLRKELRETHEMFKKKLNKERDIKMVEVGKNEKLNSQLATAKEAIKRLKAALENQEGEFVAETQSKDELLRNAEAELRLQALKIDELTKSHVEELKREKELRYNAETKKRTAMHKLKEIKNKLSSSVDSRVKLEKKYRQIQERLENSLSQSKQRLNMVKSAQATVREMKSIADKQMEAKDKECRVEIQKLKLTIKSLKQDLSASESKHKLLEKKMNDTLKQDEQFRADRVRIENERDEAKRDILKYIELGERCQQEVAIAEDKIRVMQGKVEDSQKWIQEKVLKIQDLEGKLTLQEIKNGEIKEQLREKCIEFEELKSALNSRGISLDFVLRSVKQSQQQNDRSHSRKEIRTLDTSLREKSDGVRRVSPARCRVSSNKYGEEEQQKSVEFLKRSRDGPMPEEMAAGTLWNRT